MEAATTRTGVILMNLGSPAAPTAAAYRRFLREFLSDPRVVEIPRPIWWPILNLLILPLRPAKLVASYRQIWDRQQDASPLLVITRRQAEALGERLRADWGPRTPRVTFAMSYGDPGFERRVNELLEAGVERLLVLPLYPQYSATTTAAIYDQYARLIGRRRDIPDLYINKHYYRHPKYIEALAESVRSSRAQEGSAERLLISFHGIPRRCVDRGDPYLQQCRETAGALASALALSDNQWDMSFQSRLGKAQWLEPYTVDRLRQWGRDGVKTVDVICPAFAADCLETLEEIAVEAKAVFLQAGGENLRLIPCLNDRASHIELLAQLVEENLRLQRSAGIE